MEKLLLTPEEVAEVLSVGRARVHDLMRMRLLPSVKLGRRRGGPASVLAEFVERLVEEQA